MSTGNLSLSKNFAVGTKIPIHSLMTAGMWAKQARSTHIVILPGELGKQDVLVGIKVPKKKNVFTYLCERFTSIKEGVEFRLLPINSFENMVKVFHPEAKAYFNAD